MTNTKFVFDVPDGFRRQATAWLIQWLSQVAAQYALSCLNNSAWLPRSAKRWIASDSIDDAR